MWQPLLIEFTLIISGILISLYVQRWYDERQKKEEGKAIIRQIINDLQLDTALFQSQIRKTNELTNSYEQLIQLGEQSLSPEQMPLVIQGILASDTKTSIRINEGGYLRFISMGDFEQYEDDQTVNAILHYYTAQKDLITGHTDWDRNFVENEVVPFYLNNHTENLKRFFEQTVLGKEPEPNDILRMEVMIQDKRFQSLVVFDHIIKTNYIEQIKSASKEAEKLLRLLRAKE